VSHSPAPHHLIALWNPSYADDPMDEHLRILAEWNERFHRKEAESEDVYVWWPRLRSPNRRDPLPHFDDILALNTQIENQVETHLYLTDYRSLYVGLISDIAVEHPREQNDLEHLPAYAHEKHADMFFMLDDIRRMVADDTVAVIDELARLRNVRYHHAPVSLYGGMTELPLIVERPEPRQWFADDGSLTGGRLWAEHDLLNRGETDKMGRELRENLFGDVVWQQLEYSTRVFLASAEATFRARRHDPAFDFSAPAVEYAKAIETEVNALIFRPLRKLYSKGSPQGRLVRVNERELDLGGVVPHQTLGTLVLLLGKNTEIKKAVQAVFQQKADADFILGELSSYLGQIAQWRNPAAHSHKLTREECLRLRDRVMGIGGEGMINRIALAKMRLA
jgi:hypothetical protein